ncbi:MAG: CPBP family intramembrane metalloprotease [Lachnospiraceae bacterium]|nr:CPBP family intramembrane metalloprotease [Lachnospiraceae bacterium]
MKRIYAIEANRVFLFSIAVSQGMVFLLAGAGMGNAMVQQFLIEVFLALPGVYYLLQRRLPFREALGISKLDALQWLLLIPFAFCIETIGEFVNLLSQLFATNVVGEHMMELILAYPLPLTLLVIAVMPALCEEFIFRGILYQGYKKCSVSGAVILTAVLFGLMHMNMNQLSYAVVIGILFAAVNEVTGSILPSMLLHLYINGKSTLLLYLTADEVAAAEEQYNVAELLPQLIPGVVTAILVLAAIFRVLVKHRKKVSDSAEVSEVAEAKKKGLAGWIELGSWSLLFGVLICIYFMIW